MARAEDTASLLLKHKLRFCRELDVTQVLPQLVQKRVFNFVEEREVLNKIGREKQSETFIDLLVRKTPEAVDEFVRCLEHTSTPHLKLFVSRHDLTPSGHSPGPPYPGPGSSPLLRQRVPTLDLLGTTLVSASSPDRNHHSTAGPYQDMRHDQEHTMASLDVAGRSPKINNREVERNQKSTYSRNMPEYKQPPQSPGYLKPWEKPQMKTFTDYESAWDENGDKLVWETHNVTLNKVPSLGFGIAVSGGRDNPHFANGDPSIAVSDVLKAGPAEGRLLINDRILSVNGIPLDNVDHATAISVLTDSGNSVSLVIRRKVILPPTDEFDVPYKVTLTKKNKKEDYGIVLGYRLYVKEIIANSLASQEGELKEGDTILKVNNQPIEALSLYEAKKQIEKSKEKLQLVIKSSHRPKSLNTSIQRTPEPDLSKTPPHPKDYPHKADSKDRYGPSPAAGDRSNLRPISFAQLDRPATPLLSQDGQKPREQEEGPPRPPLPNHVDQQDGPARPPSPSQDYVKKVSDYGTYGDTFYADGDTGVKRWPREIGSEPRFISFKKDGHGSVGICISGGNRSGIFVHKVAPNTPAEQQGLHEGDMILKVNDVDLRGKTREEALLMLTGLREQVNLLVLYRREEYDSLMSSGGSGDFFHIRTHFNYSETEHGEMSFRHCDVFRVTNTLHNGIVGSWEAVKLSSHNNKESKKGIIPNRNRAEQLCLTLNPDKENIPANQGGKQGKGGSFFKKKVARRAKSLGKDHWDDIIFAGAGGQQRRPANPSSKFPAYERVIHRDCGFVRPVVVLGPLADVAIDKLIREKPERYMSPQTDMRDDENKGRSTIIRFGAIRDIRDRGKHGILDVTPSAIDRLNYNQFSPIVLFLRPESKQAVKELRQKWAKSSKKSYRKLYEHAVKLEKNFSYLFTYTIPLTNGMAWYRKLQEAIEDAQRNPIWMSEIMPPEDSTKDDYLFPMGHRLSYASSPESDAEMRSPGLYSDDEDVMPTPRGQRLVRSSSDPSINTAENIPGIPPYPAPPHYNRDPRYDMIQPYERVPHPNQQDRHQLPHRGHSDVDRHGHRHHPHYHPDSIPRDRYGHNRANIDPYATLTPSERLRGQQLDPGYRSDTARGPRKSPIDRDRRRSALDQLPRGGPYPYNHPNSIYAYRTEARSQDYEKIHRDPRHPEMNGDYNKYTSHPENRHDDSKLQEKFASHQMPRSTPPDKNAYRVDPYKYTRSTINPYRTATIDKSKLSELSAKYPHEEPHPNKPRSPSVGSAPQPSPSPRGPHDREPTRAKSETNVYQESKEAPHPSAGAPETAQYFKSQPNLNRTPPDGDRHKESRPYEPLNRQRSQTTPSSQYPSPPRASSPHHGNHSTDSDADKGYESRPESTYERPNHVHRQPSSSGRAGPPVAPKNYRHVDNFPSANGDSVPAPDPRSNHAPMRSFSNQLYMDHTEIQQSSQNTSKDTYSSRDSGLPNSLERPRPASKSFELYKKLVTPGFYGSKKLATSSTSEEETEKVTEERDSSAPDGTAYNSAFESYRKPSPNSNGGVPQPSGGIMMKDGLSRDNALGTEEGHTVVATARGVFDSNGGVLESKETGVSIIIPKGAIPEGLQQEIYFKVCQDNTILPPLDKDKGETLLSPLVMCGPHGLKFLQPVELRLPHCASVNPDSWSFALKSSGSPQGAAAQWQNMTLANIEGVSQGKVGKNSVSVLVDHF